jgi:dihydroxy-acid dehydratase
VPWPGAAGYPVRISRLLSDPPLLLLGALLAATIVAFVAGIFPYPFGWIVLSALLVARLFVVLGRT